MPRSALSRLLSPSLEASALGRRYRKCLGLFLSPSLAFSGSISRLCFPRLYIFANSILQVSIRGLEHPQAIHSTSKIKGAASSRRIGRRKMSPIPSFFGRRSNVFEPFSLNVWDPFQDFPFDTSLVSRPAFSEETAQFANTRIDWKETPEAHVFKADFPGLKKEEVKVEVEDGRILQISGERSREKEDKTVKWHRVERSSGKFLRRFRLPENGKVDQVKAAMENGVLTVTVPKEEVKKPGVKSIDITGQ